MPSQPLAATPVADASGAPRGIATILPADDAGGLIALAEWRAHLDAGRLAYASPPSPDRPAHEARIRENERLLGIRRGGIW